MRTLIASAQLLGIAAFVSDRRHGLQLVVRSSARRWEGLRCRPPRLQPQPRLP